MRTEQRKKEKQEQKGSIKEQKENRRKEKREKEITEERTGSIIGSLLKENWSKSKRASKEVLDRGL